MLLKLFIKKRGMIQFLPFCHHNLLSYTLSFPLLSSCNKRKELPFLPVSTDLSTYMLESPSQAPCLCCCLHDRRSPSSSPHSSRSLKHNQIFSFLITCSVICNTIIIFDLIKTEANLPFAQLSNHFSFSFLSFLARFFCSRCLCSPPIHCSRTLTWP